MSSFIPNPLHPAIVHLPIALAVLLPFFAIGALVAIRRGARARRAWGVATALFAALSLSAWAALETGEAQEEAVEEVVAERPMHAHEEAGEAFLLLSLGVLGIAVIGLANGRVGTAARVVGTLGTAALLVSGYRVGHSGGALVYQHGAATAYAGAGGAGGVGGTTVERAGAVEGDDDRPDRRD